MSHKKALSCTYCRRPNYKSPVLLLHRIKCQRSGGKWVVCYLMLQEVTPKKNQRRQRHDAQIFRLWSTFSRCFTLWKFILSTDFFLEEEYIDCWECWRQHHYFFKRRLIVAENGFASRCNIEFNVHVNLKVLGTHGGFPVALQWYKSRLTTCLCSQDAPSASK